MRLRKNRAFARTAECVSYSRKGGNIEASVQMLAAALGGKRTGTRARKRRRSCYGAHSAVTCLRITLGTIGSIAAMPAMFKIGLGREKRMTGMQYEREMRYKTVMTVARTMLARGLITRMEFEDFDRKMTDKYNPFFVCLSAKTPVDKI